MECHLDATHLDLLQQPLVAALDPAHVALLRPMTRRVRFPADAFLFHADEPADEFYLLREGLVALQSNRLSLTIGTVGTDELLGISWLLPARRWTFNALAVQTVEALAVEVDQLLALCEQQHALAYILMRQIGTVVRQRCLETAIQSCDLYARWS